MPSITYVLKTYPKTLALTADDALGEILNIFYNKDVFKTNKLKITKLKDNFLFSWPIKLLKMSTNKIPTDKHCCFILCLKIIRCIQTKRLVG